MKVETKVIDSDLFYSGKELRPHFILEHFGVRASALVAFRGGCRVEKSDLVDLEDRMQGAFIEATSMLHLMGEFFGISLREGVLLQRLLVAKVGELLAPKALVMRSGNDLYVDGKKLSVSIVTASPVSVLLHLGINIDSTGAPVKAVGLKDLDVQPFTLAHKIVESFAKECDSLDWACAKVRPVF